MNTKKNRTIISYVKVNHSCNGYEMVICFARCLNINALDPLLISNPLQICKSSYIRLCLP